MSDSYLFNRNPCSGIVVRPEDLYEQRPDPGALRDENILAVVAHSSHIVDIDHALVNVLFRNVLEVHSQAKHLVKGQVAARGLAQLVPELRSAGNKLWGHVCAEYLIARGQDNLLLALGTVKIAGLVAGAGILERQRAVHVD